ncbi:hypothetical protein BJX68DRAFT_233097 [Aspergillus pseudodeflectus]|uniref:Uncharacterized protein n=1 Tax=Aspergillus pseudodeflectus TaxID=176178 RepID=A0ABR4KQK8_9EURO
MDLEVVVFDERMGLVAISHQTVVLVPAAAMIRKVSFIDLSFSFLFLYLSLFFLDSQLLALLLAWEVASWAAALDQPIVPVYSTGSPARWTYT